MQAICQFSRRWHQQFYKSPSFSSHSQCLRHHQPIRQYRQAHRGRANRKVPSSSSLQSLEAPSFSRSARVPLVVREYEQHGKDRSSVQWETPHPVQLEGEKVRAELAELNEELEIIKEGPFGPRSEFMRSLTPSDREKLLKALEEEGVDLQDDLSFLDDEEALEPVEENIGVLTPPQNRGLSVTLRIPAQDKAYVSHFNIALKNVENKPGDLKAHLILWKWYLRCQQKVPNFSLVISEDVWQFLWSSLTQMDQRPRHLIALAKDLLAAGASLKPEQWLDYVQALQVSGDLATALNVWQSQKYNLCHNADFALPFYQVGIGIFAALGRPSKAEMLAMECMEQCKTFHSDLLVTVIAAWADSRDSNALSKAWSLYLILRNKMESIEPKVLDGVSNVFLVRGYYDLALAVFKDLVVGQSQTSCDSVSIWNESIQRMKGFQKTNINADQINEISLSALTVFPKNLQNKFFYASWIKRLLGDGHIDAAANVVELMYERGIKPDAKHLNGIVGAWFRSDVKKDHERAEKMAWTMITKRIHVVQSRAPPDSVEDKETKHKPVMTSGGYNIPKSVDLRRPIPAANIETFSLLLSYYTTRASLDQAEELTRVMISQAHIKPNSFILNHWLYASLRQGDIQSVWTRYADFKHEIKVDLETFAALWDACKVNFDRARSAFSPEFPTPRSLFREMKLWLGDLPDKRMSDFKEEFSSELYEQIVRCFCLTGDLRGLVGVLHGLRQSFDVLPHDDIAKLIIFKAAQSAIQTDDSQRASIRRRKFKQQQLHQKLMEIFESMSEQMAAKAVSAGIASASELTDPDSKAAMIVRLDMLTMFIALIYARTVAGKEVVAPHIKSVCDHMLVRVSIEELEKWIDDDYWSCTMSDTSCLYEHTFIDDG